MSRKPVIAVCGATGRQGGSVAKYLLEDGTFTVRALTRNTESAKAVALKEAGAEVVKADFGDPASLDRAFAGCHGAFLVTNFWEGMDVGKEIREGKALADSCKAAAVKHVVWSTLEDTRPIMAATDAPDIEGMKVPHFDAKAEVTAYMQAATLPLTLLFTSIFLDNLIEFGMKPQAVGDGKLTYYFNAPEDVPLAWQAAGDTGLVVRALFKEGPEKWAGKSAPVIGDAISWNDFAATLSAATGLSVGFTRVTDAQAREASKDIPGGLEFCNMWQYYTVGAAQFMGLRDPNVSAAVAGQPLTSAKQFFEQRAEDIKAVFTA